MYSISLSQTMIRNYSNNGQHAEQLYRYTMTGKVLKADNKPYYLGADLGDVQVKSARATICNGTDLDAHLAQDKADRYAWVTADFSTAYIMTKAEYRIFAETFAEVTTGSKGSNGGKVKMRFRRNAERKGINLDKWLEARV